MSHFLLSKDYSISGVLSWEIFVDHCREAFNSSINWLDSSLHLKIAYQSGITAPDLSQRKIQLLEPKISVERTIVKVKKTSLERIPSETTDIDQIVEFGKVYVENQHYRLDDIYEYFKYCTSLEIGAVDVCTRLIHIICRRNNNGTVDIMQRIAPLIRTLQIDDQNLLVRTAELIARKASIALFTAIDLEQINDEKNRRTILERALYANRKVVAPMVISLLESGFISDLNHLKLIIRIILDPSFETVDQFLVTYHFLDRYIANGGEESFRLIAEIVRIALKNDPANVFKLLKHYGVSDEVGEAQIVKNIVKETGRVDIQHFDINDPLLRIELLREFSSQSTPHVNVDWQTLINIMRLWEIPEEIRARIALERIKMGPIDHYLDALEITNSHIYKKLVKAEILYWDYYIDERTPQERYKIEQEDSVRIDSAWVQNYYANNNLTATVVLERLKMSRLNKYFLLYGVFRVVQEYEHALENIPEEALQTGREIGVPFETGINPRETLIEVMLSYLQHETTKRAFVAALDCRNKSVAISLSTILWQEGGFPAYSTVYSSLLEKVCPSPLLWITPAKWILEAQREGEGISCHQIDALSDLFQRRKSKWRDDTSELQKQYLLTVTALDKMIFLSSAQKFNLLLAVLSLEEKESVTGLRLLANLAERNKDYELEFLEIFNPVESLHKVLCETIKRDTFLELDGVDGGADRYLDVFGQMRVPYGIETYGLQIKTLPEMRSHFNRFVISVLSDRFIEERNRVDINLHLQYILDHNEQLLQDWFSLEVHVPVEPEENIEALFMRSMSDQFENYPEFEEFLNANPSQREEIKQSLRGKGNEGRFSLACFEWIENPHSKKHMNKMSSFTPKELKSDIKAMLKEFLSLREERCAILTCHWEDLILSGEEMPDSCQKLNGSPMLIKSLLAYALDGKIKMIAIKNEKNQLVARQFLRLLWDENNEKPALFLEDLYTSVFPTPYMKKAMLEVAKESARRLGCSLFTRGNTSVKITSFGSSCPAEYVDALGSFHIGSSTDGKFTISSADSIHL